MRGYVRIHQPREKRGASRLSFIGEQVWRKCLHNAGMAARCRQRKQILNVAIRAQYLRTALQC